MKASKCHYADVGNLYIKYKNKIYLYDRCKKCKTTCKVETNFIKIAWHKAGYAVDEFLDRTDNYNQI